MRKYLILMGILAIIEISIALYLTEWRHTFWDYVENRNLEGFIVQIGVFTGVAFVFCFVSAYASYCGNLAAIEWRKVLNYRVNSSVPRSNIENLNQRIQEDCRDYPDLMLSVLFGFGKSLIYVIVFSVALIISFSWIYFSIVALYAIIGTYVANKIARPLVALNYNAQRAEATYRNDLTEFNFNNCVSIMFGLAKKTKHLNYFQTFYGQVSNILPIVIAAPAYFAGGLSLGGLMQVNSIMGTTGENMSYGINSFAVINRLLSCRKRLREINVL